MKFASIIAVLVFAFVAHAQEDFPPEVTSEEPAAVTAPADDVHAGNHEEHVKKDKKTKKDKSARKKKNKNKKK